MSFREGISVGFFEKNPVKPTYFIRPFIGGIRPFIGVMTCYNSIPGASMFWGRKNMDQWIPGSSGIFHL